MNKKPKIKRPIRAHKGGRTMQLHGRFTPEEAALIWRVLEKRETTFSDWIVEKARQDDK